MDGGAVTASSKAKGDWAEREIAGLLCDHLGTPVQRLLGAGRKEDVGDLHGLDGWTAQVAWWPSRGILRSFRDKPVECEQQQINSGDTFGVTFIRMTGGVWRPTMTLEQWCTVYRETPT
jgi:hypothetical protein